MNVTIKRWRLRVIAWANLALIIATGVHVYAVYQLSILQMAVLGLVMAACWDILLSILTLEADEADEVTKKEK